MCKIVKNMILSYSVIHCPSVGFNLRHGIYLRKRAIKRAELKEAQGIAKKAGLWRLCGWDLLNFDIGKLDKQFQAWALQNHDDDDHDG